MKQILCVKVQKVRSVINILFCGFLLAFILRLFFIASFKIPTESMQPTVLAGDFVLVSKLTPGPRFITNFFSLKNGENPKILRLKGLHTIRRNDILVFNSPYPNCENLQFDLNLYYLKRSVAIPGDTFYIENGFYRVKNCFDTLGCIRNQKGLSLQTPVNHFINWHHFPVKVQQFEWNVKNFGPLYLPKAGDCLIIDTSNYLLYQRLIEYEVNKTVSIHNETVFIGDSAIIGYTFKLNYYFVAGDNVFSSFDSRYWGLLPEDQIVGKAIIVWKSIDIKTKKIRWNRIFKKL
jgi:signal peptidase I